MVAPATFLTETRVSPPVAEGKMVVLVLFQCMALVAGIGLAGRGLWVLGTVFFLHALVTLAIWSATQAHERQAGERRSRRGAWLMAVSPVLSVAAWLSASEGWCSPIH